MGSLSFLCLFLNMSICCNSSQFLRQVNKWSDRQEWHFIEMTITLFEQSNYYRGPNKQLQFDIKHFVKDKHKQILSHFYQGTN